MRLKFGRASRSSGIPEDGGSISQRSARDWSPGCMAGFFSVFLVAGLGFSLIFVIPAWKAVKAQTWLELDCEVVRSWVESHAGDDGSTYSIEVSYRYEVDGIQYVGDRYDFLGGSSSGHRGKQKVVDQMPPGSTIACYADPDDPSSSVVHRGLSWVYLFAFLPLIFVAVGGGGLLWALTGYRSKAKAANALGPMSDGEFRSSEDWQPEPAGEPDVSAAFGAAEYSGMPSGSTGSVELEESLSPLGKLIGITLISIFWNGIVSVFVWQLWNDWSSGAGLDGCLTVFLIPFVLVGLALLTGIPYQLLALANPRPVLRLEEGSVPLGESTGLEWRFKGSTGRLGDLKIWLEGTEQATYRRGTDTHTDTEIFERVDIVNVRQGMPLDNGNATIRIPADTMHSFEAPRNKIVWKLKLHASIARWPDVITEFPFVVEPGRGAGF